MRTNIELDDELLQTLMKVSGAKTKKEAVHTAMVHAINYYARQELAKLRGKVQWDGDLEQMRTYDKWEI